MSLKYFHFTFIVISILFSAWFTYWAFTTYQTSHQLTDIVLGLISVAGTAILIPYFIHLFSFFKKLPSPQ